MSDAKVSGLPFAEPQFSNIVYLVTGAVGAYESEQTTLQDIYDLFETSGLGLAGAVTQTQLDTAIAAQQSLNDAQDAQIATLQTTVGNISAGAGITQAQLDAAIQDRATAQDAIDDAQDLIIASLQDDVTALQAGGTGGGITQSQLDASQGTQDAIIASQGSAITALQSGQAAQDATIASLGTEQAAQATRITTLETSQATQDSAITTLQSSLALLISRVDTLEGSTSAPSFTSQPVILTANVGSAITFTAPVATGSPAPTITYVLLANGVAIGDETTVLAAGQETQAITLQATASNGELPDATATSAAVTAYYPAPTAANGLVDQSFTDDTGAQTYDVSGDFTFSGTPAYSVQTGPAGVTVNSAGVVSFDTDALAVQAGTAIVIRLSDASNAANFADSAFSLDIVAGGDVTAPTATGATFGPQPAPNDDVPVSITALSEASPLSQYALYATAQPGLTAAQLQAGTGAVTSGAFSVTQASPSATIPLPDGLNGTYYLYLLLIDAAGNESIVIDAGSAAINTVPFTVPDQMAAPTLTVVSDTEISADLAADPADGGTAITSRDLRYSTDGINWTEITGVSDPQAITGLAASTAYQVQTRAVNAEGAGAWSPSASDTTNAPSVATFTGSHQLATGASGQTGGVYTFPGVTLGVGKVYLLISAHTGANSVADFTAVDVAGVAATLVNVNATDLFATSGNRARIEVWEATSTVASGTVTVTAPVDSTDGMVLGVIHAPGTSVTNAFAFEAGSGMNPPWTQNLDLNVGAGEHLAVVASSTDSGNGQTIDLDTFTGSTPVAAESFNTGGEQTRFGFDASQPAATPRAITVGSTVANSFRFAGIAFTIG